MVNRPNNSDMLSRTSFDKKAVQKRDCVSQYMHTKYVTQHIKRCQYNILNLAFQEQQYAHS